MAGLINNDACNHMMHKHNMIGYCCSFTRVIGCWQLSLDACLGAWRWMMRMVMFRSKMFYLKSVLPTLTLFLRRRHAAKPAIFSVHLYRQDCTDLASEPVRAQPELDTNVYYRRNRSWKFCRFAPLPFTGCTLASIFEWLWQNQAIILIFFFCYKVGYVRRFLCTFFHICNRGKRLKSGLFHAYFG
jgi:hypothetical protein